MSGEPIHSRIRVGKVISETFALYGAFAAPLLGSALIVFVISGVLQALLRDSGGFVLALVATVIGLIASALYTGFVVSLVSDVRDGKRDLTVGQLFSAARPAIWPLIGAAILAGIGIAIGLALLIIPGLFLLTIWAVIAPAIVIERVGVLDSFKRSHDLVRGDGWEVLGALLVGFLITVVLSFIAAAIGTSIGLGALIVIVIAVSVLTAPIPALIASILFFDLGGGTPAAASTPAAGEFSPEPPATA